MEFYQLGYYLGQTEAVDTDEFITIADAQLSLLNLTTDYVFGSLSNNKYILYNVPGTFSRFNNGFVIIDQSTGALYLCDGANILPTDNKCLESSLESLPVKVTGYYVPDFNNNYITSFETLYGTVPSSNTVVVYGSGSSGFSEVVILNDSNSNVIYDD